MSEKQPEPKHPTTLPQIAGVFSSITQATNEILGGNPVFLDEVRNLYTSFLTSPTTIKILGYNPTTRTNTTNPSDPLRKEILAIKDTVTALSKAVKGQQPKSNPPQTHTQPTQGTKSPPTYASKTATRARPSVVVELEKQRIVDRLTPEIICNAINEGVKTHPAISQVRVSAARWTARGNLVITAGPTTPEKLLNSALVQIAYYAKKILTIPIHANTTARANVRWSRLLLNRVPTGTTDESEAHDPNTCHESLLAENPSYATLTITQRPSWVKTPSSYTAGSVSSLSFAFEDPDGSLATALLSEKELYIFGAAAAVKKWKQKPPQKKPPTPPEPQPTQAKPNTPNTQTPAVQAQQVPSRSRPRGQRRTNPSRS